jgi:hypothetical protein
MKEIKEADLHLYLINKQLLDDELKKEIETRLETDKNLQDKFEEVKEFYFNLKRMDAVDKIYQMMPMEMNFPGTEQIVLAAQQSIDTESKLRYIKTFISSEKYVMIRMFHNPKADEYEFYVICDDDKIVDKAIIRIPSLNKELITDESGFAKTVASYLPDNIELSVMLR